MGSSLADRAWSRESAVFRITGVLSVIGGWFITAGAAFIVCYLITNILVFGSFAAMIAAVVIAVVLLVRSNLKYKGEAEKTKSDLLFAQLCRSHNKIESWQLLKMHVNENTATQLQFASTCFRKITDAFLHEEYRPLKQATHEIETARKQLKRQRRREIIGLRKIDSIMALEKNTWFFLTNSSMEQMLYCLKRINDPCREHIGNNFSPVDTDFSYSFVSLQTQITDLLHSAEHAISNGTLDSQAADTLRREAEVLQRSISAYHKRVIDSMQHNNVNIESTTTCLNMLQETTQMLSCLRHMLRGIVKFLN